MLQCITTQFINQWLLSLWRICAMSHRRVPVHVSRQLAEVLHEYGGRSPISGCRLGLISTEISRNHWHAHPLQQASECGCLWWPQDGGWGWGHSHDVRNPLVWLFLKEKKAKSRFMQSPNILRGGAARMRVCTRRTSDVSQDAKMTRLPLHSWTCAFPLTWNARICYSVCFPCYCCLWAFWIRWQPLQNNFPFVQDCILPLITATVW